ncbi:hypothetical protein D9756_008107 [Leucocoprinus leucothites]|uniref:Uncharacterized protein n=1 Tax=Leucocoprinus leucothites TaxID=201217 RepID=A0A8H5D5B3_9AGAR|nr:hypothetical protein D9756_008107 [Leucoagaricus leucothites]
MAEDARKRRKLNPLPDGFLPSKKPPQRLHAPKFQSAFDTPGSSSSSSKNATKPPSLPPLQNNPVVVQETKRVISHMRRQPIPTPPVLSDVQPTKTTVLMKRHEPPTVLARPTTSVKPMSASSYFLKEPPAPPAPQTKPLKKRAPPIPELLLVPDTKDMKPLSTTHFASLTDISLDDDDDDSVGLSSLLLRLQEHKAGIQPSESRSDILISPQKNKHIRGGLASRAAQLYKRSHTSLYLWRTSLESQPLQQTSSDLTFRINKLIHTISTGSHKPCISITLCRILTPVRPFSSRKQRVYILLKLPHASKSSSFSLCNPQNLQEGVTIRIWRPWHEITLVQHPPGATVEMPNASLPLPSSNDSGSIPFDENTHNTVLLCSRFSIIKDLT